jgi:hypothetical protein
MVNGHEVGVVPERVCEADVAGRPQSPPRRRLGIFRVSVRALLVLILIIGCGLGWMAQVIRTGQDQRRAVAAIYQAGGWVVYDMAWEQQQNKPAWKPVWPQWLVDCLGVDYFGNVVFINLHDRGTDELLARVAQLGHLKQLHRPGSAVTDAGLAHLGRLRALQFLSLDDTQVTDAGIASSTGLRGLRFLKVSRTKVTENGVAELRKSLPHLQVIR